MFASIATSASAAGIEHVSWLAGCWKGGNGDRVVEEQWMAARGGLMLGMSRMVAADQLRAHESMRIQEEGGRLVFRPSRKASPRTRFARLPRRTTGSCSRIPSTISPSCHLFA
ncbi:MAG: DUF6265 family protein [Burkholderiaceae bacterium]